MLQCQGAKASALTVAGTFVGKPLPKALWLIPSTECLPDLFYYQSLTRLGIILFPTFFSHFTVELQLLPMFSRLK
jgi:hypothetical protein